MKITWLASYPKSGNTFLRMLLYGYFFSLTDESINIDNKIPDLHKLLSGGLALKKDVSISFFMKTHFMFSTEHPYSEQTGGFIYVLRNPRDVLLSNARYHGINKDNLQQLRGFAIDFIKQMGMERWKQMQMGNWPQHLSSWLQSTDVCPHCFVKYEDLKTNPKENLRKIIEFLGSEIVEEKIETAMQFASIEEARKMEQADKKKGRKSFFDELPGGEFFVGEGKMNQSLTFLGEDVERLYKNRFGKFINLFGYE